MIYKLLPFQLIMTLYYSLNTTAVNVTYLILSLLSDTQYHTTTIPLFTGFVICNISLLLKWPRNILVATKINCLCILHETITLALNDHTSQLAMVTKLSPCITHKDSAIFHIKIWKWRAQNYSTGRFIVIRW